MKIINVTEEEIQQTLKKINDELYHGNVYIYTEKYVFKELIALFIDHRILVEAFVTLKTKDYERLGYSRSPTKLHRQSYACWHVYGHFFDALLEINPDAVISTSPPQYMGEIIINRDGGNWTDWERGTPFYGFHMQSQLCDCH